MNGLALAAQRELHRRPGARLGQQRADGASLRRLPGLLPSAPVLAQGRLAQRIDHGDLRGAGRQLVRAGQLPGAMQPKAVDGRQPLRFARVVEGWL